MNVTKEKLENLIRELPDMVDVDEVMYRLYLFQKIEAGEAAIKEGNMLSHDEAMKRLSSRIRPTCL
jgi:predicted transcriptional regulator